jgi:hypothetical protein
MDILDEHFYNNDPAYFESNAHLFDNASRGGPKIIVGEYATLQGSPTGTLAGALGEAAFLTGLERNADLVIGASYAPLLVNVNAPSWPTNLIGYNGLSSYGSPSYWAQRMLVTGHGDHVVSSQVVAGSGTLFQVASHAPGHTYLAVVNDGTMSTPMMISLSGESGATGGTATVLSGDPTGMNSLAHPEAIAPRTNSLGRLGSHFRYTFPANSLTVLDLSTVGGASARTARSFAGASPRISAAQISRQAISSGVSSMRTATLTIRPGGSLNSTIVAASAVTPATIKLISRDGRRHELVVRTPRPHSVTVPAHGRASMLIRGLEPGRYVIDVDGLARGVLLVAPRWGP